MIENLNEMGASIEGEPNKIKAGGQGTWLKDSETLRGGGSSNSQQGLH